MHDLVELVDVLFEAPLARRLDDRLCRVTLLEEIVAHVARRVLPLVHVDQGAGRVEVRPPAVERFFLGRVFELRRTIGRLRGALTGLLLTAD